MRQGEKFAFALAASLALHLSLLWPAFPFGSRGAAEPPLSVVLRAAGAASPQRAAERAPREPVRAERKHRARAAPVEELRPPPAPPSTSRADTPNSTTETPARSGGGAAATVASGTSPSRAAGAAADAPDADGMRRYRVALATEARRFKRYPPRALAEEIGGTVEVRVAVAAGGRPPQIALAHSSGDDALDAAALDMLRRAAPRTAVPAVLRGRSFVIDLPVVFEVASE